MTEMKKILLAIAAAVVSMTAGAQGIKIQKTTGGNTTTVASFVNTDADKYQAMMTKTPGKTLDTNANLIQAWFSVSPTKTVQFAKGNLYCNASGTEPAWSIASSQLAYETGTQTNTKIDHFYWSKNASTAYSLENYSETGAVGDAFFCDESYPLTIDGISLYALKASEWTYLICERPGHASLVKWGVKVGTAENCLIIAPDNFTGSFNTTYDTEDGLPSGVLCLPAAGYRDGSTLSIGGSYGYYWSGTPDATGAGYAYGLNFYSGYVFPASSYSRKNGFAVRLAK